MSTQRHKSTYPYCGFGCGLMVGVERGKVVAGIGFFVPAAIAVLLFFPFDDHVQEP